MEWSKLKNMILLLLLCVNIFLLALVGTQQSRSARYTEETQRAAIATLERSGITVAMERLPKDVQLTPLSVERSRENDRSIAEHLLGVVEETVENEIRWRYTSPNGTAEFAMNGDFTVEFVEGALVRSGGQSYAKASESCLEQLDLEGILAESREAGEYAHLTYVQSWDDIPVFSCNVAFTWEGDTLRRIEGRRLVGTATPVQADSPLSTTTVLIRFLAGLNAGGYVCSRIDEMTAGYRLSGTARSVQLNPVWQIVTDTGVYYVDGIHGELSTEA